MNQHRLLFELDQVASRFRLLRFWQLLAAAWLVAALVRRSCCGALKSALRGRWCRPCRCWRSRRWRWPASASGWRRRRPAIPAGSPARSKRRFPSCARACLAAVEQRPELARTGGLAICSRTSFTRRCMHADRHEWREVVPMRRIAAAAAGERGDVRAVRGRAAGHRSDGCLAVDRRGRLAGLAAARRRRRRLPSRSSRATPKSSAARACSCWPASPGRCRRKRRSSIKPEGGEEARLAMSASLNDPVFGGRIPVVDAAAGLPRRAGRPEDARRIASRVRVSAAGEGRRQARLSVSTRGWSRALVQDVRTVSVVEGTELTLMCYLNKPVAIGDADRRQARQPIALATRRTATSPAYQTTIRCDADAPAEAGAGRRRRAQERQAGAVHDQRAAESAGRRSSRSSRPATWKSRRWKSST